MSKEYLDEMRKALSALAINDRPMASVMSKQLEIMSTVLNDGIDARDLVYSVDSLTSDLAVAMKHDCKRDDPLRNVVYGMSHIVGAMVHGLIEKSKLAAMQRHTSNNNSTMQRREAVQRRPDARDIPPTVHASTHNGLLHDHAGSKQQAYEAPINDVKNGIVDPTFVLEPLPRPEEDYMFHVVKDEEMDPIMSAIGETNEMLQSMQQSGSSSQDPFDDLMSDVIAKAKEDMQPRTPTLQLHFLNGEVVSMPADDEDESDEQMVEKRIKRIRHDVQFRNKLKAGKKKLVEHRWVCSICQQRNHCFSCSICDEPFDRSDRLNDHLRRQHRILPFDCITCGERFNMVSDLKEHWDQTRHQTESKQQMLDRSTTKRKHLSLNHSSMDEETHIMKVLSDARTETFTLASTDAPMGALFGRSLDVMNRLVTDGLDGSSLQYFLDSMKRERIHALENDPNKDVPLRKSVYAMTMAFEATIKSLIRRKSEMAIKEACGGGEQDLTNDASDSIHVNSNDDDNVDRIQDAFNLEPETSDFMLTAYKEEPMEEPDYAAAVHGFNNAANMAPNNDEIGPVPGLASATSDIMLKSFKQEPMDHFIQTIADIVDGKTASPVKDADEHNESEEDSSDSESEESDEEPEEQKMPPKRRRANVRYNEEGSDYDDEKRTRRRSSKTNRRRSPAEDAEKRICAVCSRCFLQKASFLKHMALHMMGRTFISGSHGFAKNDLSCNICNAPFTRKDKLDDHLRMKHRILPFDCGTCGKRFDKAQQLKNHWHKSGHQVEKPSEMRRRSCGKRDGNSNTIDNFFQQPASKSN